jgi:hypothetical protein
MATPVETAWIEYWKLLLSPQAIIGIVVAGFVIYFRAELRYMLKNVRGFKFPGIEFSTQQQKLEEQQQGANAPAPEKRPEPKLEELHLNAVQIDELRKYFEAERAAARIWEYRYLNYFLAPSTQTVLNWFVTTGHTTYNAAEAIWMPLIQQAAEREAIYHVLQAHWLITISGAAMAITDKGREYATWEGRQYLFSPSPTAAAPTG